MRIYHDIKEFDLQACVATVGMFDGVHRGHASLIDELKTEAARLGLPAVVVTFWPHPKCVIEPLDHTFSLLNTLDEKVALLSKTGLDALVVVPFTTTFSRLTPEEFITQIMLEKLRAKYFVMGYNHRFGAGKRDAEDYEKISHAAGLPCRRAAKYAVDTTDCSSSAVRHALSIGDVALAAKILGYDYAISGKIVHGDKIGRQIGYPTANIDVREQKKILPADGVYAARAEISGSTHKAVVNVGYRPTVGGNEKRVEVHVINYNTDIYDQHMNVQFVQRIRGEKHFDSLQQLRSQIDVDIRKIKTLL